MQRAHALGTMQRSTQEPPHEALHAVLEHTKHVLPAQGPIGTFVHHNTLHAYEHLSFHEAIAEACELRGARGYLSEEKYRAALREERITLAGIDEALAQRGTDGFVGKLSRRSIERLQLAHGILPEAPAGFRWRTEEQQLTTRFRDDVSEAAKRKIIDGTHQWIGDPSAEKEFAKLLHPRTSLAALRALYGAEPSAAAVSLLWNVCAALHPRRKRAHGTPAELPHRHYLQTVGALDPARAVSELLGRFLSSYLDEGMARWSMPDRHKGLLVSAEAFLRSGGMLREEWVCNAQERLAAHLQAQASTTDLLLQLLNEFDVPQAQWDDWIPRFLFAQAGWSGMIARLETHPEDRRAGAPSVALDAFLALRLLLEAECVQSIARSLGHRGSLPSFLKTLRHRSVLEAHEDGLHGGPFLLFQLAQLAGIAPRELWNDGPGHAQQLVDALERFTPLQRQRVFQEAFEQHHLHVCTSAIEKNRAHNAQEQAVAPRFQVLFCIDDREEAMRRHFEELAPDHYTFGVAGFFGVAMNFRSLDDPRPSALCPVVVTPQHAVEEEVEAEEDKYAQRRARRRRAYALLRREVLDASQSFARGALLTPFLGVLAAIPLALTVFFPRKTAQLSERVRTTLLPPPKTHLVTDRDAAHPALGFTLTERIERVAATLENIGLTRNFAPLVALLGHGASTNNNPHHSAYECGACGGRNGGPNARAFAAIANEPEVREGLRARGIELPNDCWFLGGWHDTTTDAVTLFDTDRVPEQHRSALKALTTALDQARGLSAQERCRRFEHAPVDLTPEQALVHVEERSVDLSQARPELGHATNAMCIVGRRTISKGLFLDRRSFLVSYDPSTDAEGALLERILGAVVPVGAGINLEYYFSTVDEDRWGAGTKLPHNLVGLLGVLEGVSGDLRTGLPRQMIEVHEPVRLLCVVEATPEALLRAAKNRPEVGRLVGNGWVRLVSMDPDTGKFLLFRGGEFVPFQPNEHPLPVVATARDWYRGHSSFLPPARLQSKREGSQTARKELHE